MDMQVTVVSHLQPTPKRTGKRKKIQAPRYNECAIGPRRTWSGVATFGLMSTFPLAFTAGAGATNGPILGPKVVGLSSFAMGATGLLHHADQWNEPPRIGRVRLPLIEEDRRHSAHRTRPSLAHALATAPISSTSTAEPRSRPTRDTERTARTAGFGETAP